MADYVELQVLGYPLRLNCPESKQDELLKTANDFEEYVVDLRSRSKTLKLEVALILAGINLFTELNNQSQGDKVSEQKLLDLCKLLNIDVKDKNLSNL